MLKAYVEADVRGERTCGPLIPRIGLCIGAIGGSSLLRGLYPASQLTSWRTANASLRVTTRNEQI
jgi:hypothetical protein